jgi:hypothetical protein
MEPPGLGHPFRQAARLERKSAEGGMVLTERLKRLLQRCQARTQDTEAHVESPRPG